MAAARKAASTPPRPPIPATTKPSKIVVKRWHVPLAIAIVAMLYKQLFASGNPAAPAADAAADAAATASASATATSSPITTSVASAATVSADCADHSSVATSCPTWAGAGECEANPRYMLVYCAASCGCLQPPDDAVVIDADAGQQACTDRDKSGACSVWAAAGECEANPAFMKLKCAASCNSCDWLDYKKRCPMPEDRVAAVAPHTMEETFERALTLADLGPEVLSREPWVISFERFASDEEVAALLSHAEGRFERSTASGGRKDDEFIPLKSDIRTSWTTWCDQPACLEDPLVRRLYERVSNVTRVPPDNFEYMQLLRYYACPHPGHADCQFYKRHHDTIPELTTMQPGPRVYTFFLYLSDVEEGGGTRFDGGFTVQPRKGKALLWPATRSDDPFVSDDRTHHEALPVTKGTKYAANFWLHQYDYVSAHKSGCTT